MHAMPLCTEYHLKNCINAWRIPQQRAGFHLVANIVDPNEKHTIPVKKLQYVENIVDQSNTFKQPKSAQVEVRQAKEETTNAATYC